VRIRKSKVDQATLEILEREASIRKLCTPYKVLAKQTGLAPGYIAKAVWNLMHGNEYSAPRGTSQRESTLDDMARSLRSATNNDGV
jgi:hypothetical protein